MIAPTLEPRLGAAKAHARRIVDDPILRWSCVLASVYLVGYMAATLVLPETSMAAKLLVDIVYTLPEMGALVLLVVAARRSPRSGWVWWCAALATAMSLAGDVNWAVDDLVLGEPPSPSIGDFAYMLQPIVLTATFVLAARRLRPRLRDLPDLLIPFGAVGFAVYHLVIAPQLASGLSAATVPSVAQSLASVGAALLATWIVAGHRRLPIGAYSFYWSVVASAASYPVYAYAVSDSGWARVNWVYTGFQASFLLAALAGVAVLRMGEPYERPVRVVSDTNAWLLSAGLALVLGAIAITSRGGRVDPQARVVAAVAVAVVTVRLHQIMRQRSRLAADLARSLAAQERLAATDPLTDLPNQRGFDQALRGAVADGPVGLAVFDVDQFKRVNDGYGHAAGDELLHVFGRRLRDAVGDDDALARLGGGEFAVLVATADRAHVADVAERCRTAAAGAPFQVEGHEIRISASAGIAVFPTDAADAETLVQVAFRALSHAKREGGNRTCAFAGGHVRTLPVPDSSAYSFLERLADQLDAEQAEQEHSLAMLDLAGRLADRLKLSTTQRRRCLLAARFHDIGKVGIPQAILTKPGPLSEHEWEVMREHVRIGVDLLRRCPETIEIAHIVAEHHERPDGRGYPAGKHGEEISAEAKIITAADAWTAMRADRAYRPALSIANARAEMRAGRGSQFDAAVVDALLELVAEEDDAVDGQLGILEEGAETPRAA